MTDKEQGLRGLELYRYNIKEQKTRNAITAAAAIFRSDGFTGATMAKLATATPCSTATLYKHFSSKEGLFAACILESDDPLDLVRHMLVAEGKLILTKMAAEDVRTEGIEVLDNTLEQFITMTSGHPSKDKGYRAVSA